MFRVSLDIILRLLDHGGLGELQVRRLSKSKKNRLLKAIQCLQLVLFDFVCFCLELLKRLKQYFWCCFVCLKPGHWVKAAQMKPDADGNTPAIMVLELSFHAGGEVPGWQLPATSTTSSTWRITYATFDDFKKKLPQGALWRSYQAFPLAAASRIRRKRRKKAVASIERWISQQNFGFS